MRVRWIIKTAGAGTHGLFKTRKSAIEWAHYTFPTTVAWEVEKVILPISVYNQVRHFGTRIEIPVAE
jgi:hypothetical protein